MQIPPVSTSVSFHSRIIQTIALTGLLLSTPASGFVSTVFGIKSIDGGSGPTQLFSFLDDGTGFSDLGAVKLASQNIDADALAFSSSSGLLAFQVTAGSSTLIRIDPITAVAAAVGSSLAGRDIRGAVFDSMGNLRVVDSAANQLLQIDPLTGLIIGTPVDLTLSGNSFNLADSTDLAYRRDGTLYLTSEETVYTLSPGGILAAVFSDFRNAYPGVAFTSASDDIFAYEVNGTDDIYRYPTDSGLFPETNVFENIIPSFNAGRGDLAAIVPEPSSWFLTAAGLIGAVSLRRRRSHGEDRLLLSEAGKE